MEFKENAELFNEQERIRRKKLEDLKYKNKDPFDVYKFNITTL